MGPGGGGEGIVRRCWLIPSWIDPNDTSGGGGGIGWHILLGNGGGGGGILAGKVGAGGDIYGGGSTFEHRSWNNKCKILGTVSQLR